MFASSHSTSESKSGEDVIWQCEAYSTFHSDAVGVSDYALQICGGTLVLAAVRLWDILKAQNSIITIFGCAGLRQDSIFPDPLDIGRGPKWVREKDVNILDTF